jgi:phosphoribosylanthranilate isomerase
MTRIKFCGLTRVQDVHAATRVGAHALGFVCVPSSKRYVVIEQAQQLVRATPAFVQTVGLFQDADAEFVRAVLDAAPFDLLQFHGNEPNAFCAQFGRAFIKAIPMADAPDLLECVKAFPQAKALLLDSHSLIVKKQTGGSGHVFDWQQVAESSKIAGALPIPIVLAGGLKVENLAVAIRLLRPYAVDVSSGIESAQGIKDVVKMQAFVDAVLTAKH